MTQKLTVNNHPQKATIHGTPEYQLLNKRRYVNMAIRAHKRNDYNYSPEDQEFNVNFFEVLLEMIDRELKSIK